MEYWKDFFELLSSIFFLIAAIIGMSAFKYKYDSNTRDLYIENSKKIREVLGYIISYGKINPEMYNQARIAFQEASLYLHSDIIAFTEKVLDLIIELEKYGSQLEDLKVGEKRSKIVHLEAKVKEQLWNLNKEALNIYRKHIVQSPIGKLKIWWLEEIKSSFILGLFRKKTN